MTNRTQAYRILQNGNNLAYYSDTKIVTFDDAISILMDADKFSPANPHDLEDWNIEDGNPFSMSYIEVIGNNIVDSETGEIYAEIS